MPKIKWTKVIPKPDPIKGVPCARSSHGLSIVNNGSRLVLYGGENVARTPLTNDQALWYAERVSDEWQWKWVDSSNGPPARVAHAQDAQSNDVYIFGGRAGITMQEQAMNDVWKLDTNTDSWTDIKCSGENVPEERSFHRMIHLQGGLYTFGGCTASHGRAADLHRLDLATSTWTSLGTSQLRGRGGPNLLPLASNQLLAAVAGFAGEETADGQGFDLKTGQWKKDSLLDLSGMRPRSVCVSASFPSVGVSVIFGGEVDPSALGHEGAGGFENDIVLLEEKTGKYLESIPSSTSPQDWPETRGWSDGAYLDDGSGTGRLYVFGGLSGDDSNPIRLDDLWELEIQAD